MKEIHETTQLESQQSAYHIHLVKHNSGSLYVEIEQTLYGDHNSLQSIRINPSILNDLIRVLQKYQAKLPLEKTRNTVSELDQEHIQTYYFKGVSIKDISRLLSQEEASVEIVLRNRGIAIVSNEIPRAKYLRRRKKRY